jgi:hypothetical protein
MMCMVIVRLVVLQPSPLAAGSIPDRLDIFILILSGTTKTGALSLGEQKCDLIFRQLLRDTY